jgi:tetratricopeptide (TPR) repeat protein
MEGRQETRKRRSRPARRGRKLIRVSSCRTPFLSGFIYPVLGEFAKAAEEARKNVELAPDNGVGYFNLGYDSVSLDRLGEAENAARAASERKIESPYLFLLRYDVAFLKGEKGGMQREGAAARGKSGAEDWISDHQALALAYTGHLQESRKMSRRASDLAAGGRS